MDTTDAFRQLPRQKQQKLVLLGAHTALFMVVVYRCGARGGAAAAAASHGAASRRGAAAAGAAGAWQRRRSVVPAPVMPAAPQTIGCLDASAPQAYRVRHPHVADARGQSNHAGGARAAPAPTKRAITAADAPAPASCSWPLWLHVLVWQTLCLAHISPEARWRDHAAWADPHTGHCAASLAAAARKRLPGAIPHTRPRAGPHSPSIAAAIERSRRQHARLLRAARRPGAGIGSPAAAPLRARTYWRAGGRSSFCFVSDWCIAVNARAAAMGAGALGMMGAGGTGLAGAGKQGAAVEGYIAQPAVAARGSPTQRVRRGRRAAGRRLVGAPGHGVSQSANSYARQSKGCRRWRRQERAAPHSAGSTHKCGAL